MNKELIEKMHRLFLEGVSFDGPQELWSLVSDAQYVLNNETIVKPENDKSTPETRQLLVLELLRRLLDEKVIELDFFLPPSHFDYGDDIVIDCIPAKGSPEQIIEYIRQEWDKLGREPNVMEIAQARLVMDVPA